ncbi:hypothetical protein TGME49_258512 [Toxoplasma gondii ME49]|uniref:cAMP-specific phosphodiesterase n=3 Tax=Toxoplasma gondii TaxID=5811 RepID=A0A125YKH6_TOXGV|nr:hypothetical protein TGME49_258512 [Toxoplasma gondii ME49]EPT29348.1 hypothetical protein TGME49_258512 [Toxoplasma gondii ME49]ESS32202.1 putative cAMP-specific phosphodiesterase [Toxoplasma gondii VEG]KYF41743.1 putative cAMP-specific phosphodiesterase [Toxoplasma gondii ARI]|eukprot:XP_018637016.1 hypothetical protein TGME49_258512 [Toxoplasma gondii ME49]
MACTQDNFPAEGCEDELGITIEYRGNKYTRFFSFPAPEGITQSKYSGDYYDSYTSCKDMALDPSGALWRQFVSQSYRQLIIQPNYTKACEIFGPSADFCDNHEDRLHTCFLGCRRPEDTAAKGYTMDNRPPCISGKETKPPLLCIYPEDIANFTFFDKMIGSTCIYSHSISGNDDPSGSASDVSEPIWCFGALQLFGAIVAANFLQLVFEILLLRVLDMANEFIEQSLVLRSRKCLYIFIMSAILGAAAFACLGAVTIVGRVRLDTALIISFFLTLAVDQVRFFLVQPIIWWVILRRCGKLSPVGVQEYDDDYLTLFQTETSLVDTGRKLIGELMSTIVFQRVFLSLLLAYTAFLLVEFLLLNNVPDYNLIAVPNIDQVSL